MKEIPLQIRVPEELKKAFQEACKANDQTASQVIREMMRQYVRDNATGRREL